MMLMEFRILLLKEFFKNLKNDYTDNYTADCGSSLISDGFSPYHVAPAGSVSDYARFFCKIYNFAARNKKYFIGKYYKGFKYLHGILNDKESKDILIKVLAYRMLGYRKVKLPLNNPWYWKKIDEIERYFSKEDTLRAGSTESELKRINLEKIGYPINIYYSGIGVMTEFAIKQYEYKDIRASRGDVVIDGGACYGDTALFFANEVGGDGKVFSFEFIPANLKILSKNIEINDNLKNRIEVVENPLWSTSGETMSYNDNGPSSKVSTGSDDKNKANTISIDDFVKQKGLKKINLIKMDIEGAESEALKGAVNTIKKFRPKLAICLYHKLDDFITIPRFLNELGVGYKFYLKHSSIYAGETVLFAAID